MIDLDHLHKCSEDPASLQVTEQRKARRDQEALDWFNVLVYGFACYDPRRWYGHPRSHEYERGLTYGRLLRLERAFIQAWKFTPDPFGRIPSLEQQRDNK